MYYASHLNQNKRIGYITWICREIIVN